MDGALRDVIAILLSGGGIDQQIRKRAQGLTIFRRRFGICLDIRRRDSFHLQLFCVFRIGTLFIAVQGIGNRRVLVFRLRPVPALGNGNRTPVHIFAEHVGQGVVGKFLGIQAVRDVTGYHLADRVIPAPPILVKLGQLLFLRAKGIDFREKISVASFDKTDALALVDFPLSYVEQPIESIGKEAVNILINRIKGTPYTIRKVFEGRVLEV